MFKSPRTSLCKITDSTPTSQQDLNFLARSLAQPFWKVIFLFGLISVGNSPLLAAPTAANVEIENQATGSFTDGEDPAAVAELIVSNIVKVTVAEVAGITVSTGIATEAPAAVTSAGPLQGDGTINAGDLAYFDYVITNTGNDSTQFFIPDAPSSITGGTFNATTNPIQIIAYNPTGSNNTILATPVTVPTGGKQTGPSTATGTDGLLGKNGIIPAGGSITIRVPIKVNSAVLVGDTISVTIGNTPSNAQNQAYSNNSNQDIYTQDNSDGTTDASGTVVEAAGTPINGVREASNIGTTTIIVEPLNISGTVFEDVNYGGGAGRSLMTSTGIVRPNVRVEIYDATDNYLGATLTDVNGKYKFNQFNATTGFTASKAYKIRVVNSFVTSSRTGGCTQAADLNTPPAACTQMPVQTFRTSLDASGDRIADADTQRVGGELPAKLDPPLNSSLTLTALNAVSGQAVASLTTVNLGTLSFSGVDFGYNFDTIVNTNDAGQGSLRQFILNSNALGNTGLAQVGQAAQQEVSIFMIPPSSGDPQGRPGDPGFTSGLAKIKPIEPLPTIIDDRTSIDGSTQTTYSGNTNPAIANITTGPEILIDGSNQTYNKGPGIQVAASNVTIANLGITKMPGYGHLNVSPGEFGNRGTAILFSAGGTIKPAGTVLTSTNLTLHDQIVHNVTAWDNGGAGLLLNSQGGSIKTVSIDNSIFGKNGFDQPAGVGLAIADGISFDGNNSEVTIQNNTIVGNAGYGIDLAAGKNQNNLIRNNSIVNNGARATDQISQANDPGQLAGIAFRYGGENSDNIVRQNIISGNAGDGIVVTQSANQNNTFTQNSIYNNGELGIDLGVATSGNAGDGILGNDGIKSSTLPNSGMDYPILISSSLSVNTGISTLSVKGYVGNLPAGSTTFANATIEFFVGAADTNDKGRVFSTDPATVAKLHAEGQTYLGTCIADANGLFGTVAKPCAFIVPTGTDIRNITSTATDSLGNTSEFSPAVASDPNVLLVKRITAINGLPTKLGGGSLSTYSSYSAYDNNDNTIPNPIAPVQKTTDKWPTPSTFLLGSIDGGTVAPQNTIEYTIYFLSAGDSTASNVLFCDRVPSNVTFMPTAFNSLPTPSGTYNDRGIAVNLGGTLKGYTNSADSDVAQYFPPGVEPSTVYPNINCGKNTSGQSLPNDNGAVVVNLGNIPNATSSGQPPASYGFVRFQGLVK